MQKFCVKNQNVAALACVAWAGIALAFAPTARALPGQPFVASRGVVHTDFQDIRSRNLTAYLHGTVEKVDVTRRTISLHSLPFWEFPYRDVARDCVVAEDVDLARVHVGVRVTAFLRRKMTGDYYVASIKPD